MTLLFIYLFLALFISFLCSILEAVLLSTPVSYVRSKAEQGSKASEKFIQFKGNIENPLSAILTLNTIAHTVGAAGVGAQAITVFGEAYFGLVSAILTILILVLTEIIPKTIGANYYKELLGISVPLLNLLIFVTYPLVWFSSRLSRLISNKSMTHTTTREEFSALANLGVSEGTFEDKENKIIQNLIKLKELKVSDVMTPRVVVVAAEEEMSAAEFLKKKEFLHFSRIPIFRDQLDNVIGYVFRGFVFEKLADKQLDFNLKDIKRNIVTIPESVTLLTAWEMLLEKKEHIALIVDEYGGMAGIVTMEDIIETLLGFEIIDEKDTINDMQQYAKERWQARKLKYNLLDQD